jgi:hypothetical protein
MAMRVLRTCLGCALALVLVGPAAPAGADLGSIRAACVQRDAADGDISNGLELPFRFCDDGVPSAGGTNPNPGAVKALPVPQRYAGFAGLPQKASPDPGSGADVNGDVALDADLYLPDTSLRPRPAHGYPLMVMMHTCCGSDKTNFEAATVDAPGETWHYSNAWFAARGYVVLKLHVAGLRELEQPGLDGRIAARFAPLRGERLPAPCVPARCRPLARNQPAQGTCAHWPTIRAAT